MAISTVLESLRKRFGNESVVTFSDEDKQEIEVISTSCPSLDKALGVGGVPRGRVVEVYGPESSGKTTLCLHIIAEAQKKGGTCAFIDVEHALDPVYAEKLGVDLSRMLVSQPDSGEQALEMVEAFARSGEIDVIILDSVAALVTQAELNGEMGDAMVGVNARLMAQGLRKLTPVVSKSNVCLIFINQLRSTISTGGWGGPTETTTGGRALRFYASVRLDIRRIGQVKAGERVIGNRTKVKVAKNKLAPPYKEVEFDIIYSEGISKEGDLLDVAITAGVIKQKGAWFSFDEQTFAQGRENAREHLKTAEFYDTILERVNAS